MATCKECLHNGVCGGYLVSDLDKDVWDYAAKGKTDEIPDIEERCNSFKSTADVVEAVRCKDCKYQDDCARQMVHTTRDYVLEQNISTYNKVDFCSYGKRKEVE